MKKTLLAIAVLGAAAMTAQAANVTLYGGVDGGFMYKNAKQTFNGKVAKDSKFVNVKENSFKLADGLDGANKFGLKGEEELGNGYAVGFKLENGFHIANGSFNADGKLFDREARLYVKGPFGELAAGRFGGIGSSAGTYNTFFHNADAFDGGDNDVPYAFAHSTRYDNSIAYQSPEVVGLQGTLMYSFNKAAPQENKFKDNDRYLGAGLTFKQDKLTLVGVVEAQLRTKTDKDKKLKNGFVYDIGGNYDFGVAKLYTGAQVSRNTTFKDVSQGVDFDAYLKGQKAYEGDVNKDARKKAIDPIVNSQVNGYAFTLGGQIPVGSDTVTLGSYFGRYKNSSSIALNDGKNTAKTLLTLNKKDGKMTVYGFAARYEHSLSKRTTLYTGAGIGQTKITVKNVDGTIKSRVAQVYAGLHHNF